MRLPENNKPISGFKLDLLANFAGTGWSAILQLAVIPIYIKLMGIEAYGLIGFYLILQGVLQILDIGLSPTMTREMARYSVHPEKAAEARDLVRTLETGYWMIGLVIGAFVLTASPFIAKHWIKASALPVRDIRQAVMLMAMLAFFQWPVTFYQGGLMGLNRQVLYNSLKIVMVSLTHGGAVLVLWLVSPTIQAFLLWQSGVAMVQALMLSFFLWTRLPRASRAPRLDLGLVRKIWTFAAGVSGITLTGLILGQLDKVIVSKLLDLSTFAYYTLGWVLASGMWVVTSPVFNVVYPRFSALIALGDENKLKQTYHRTSQLMAVLILPLAAVLSVFAFDLVRLWTRSVETAHHTAPIVSVLVIGSALNGLLHLPYALQLASGWTRIGLFAGLASITLAVPAILLLTTRYGVLGAACVWAGLNILTTLIIVPLTHRRLLKGQTWRYYGDVGLPLFFASLVVAAGRILFTNLTPSFSEAIVLLGIWLSATIAAVLAAPEIRSWMLLRITKRNFLYA